MKKLIKSMISLLAVVMSLTACSDNDNTRNILHEPHFEELYISQSEAYFSVFLSAIESWSVPNNENIATIALDLSEMSLQDNRNFICLVEKFCKEHDLIFLLDTWHGNYIRGGIFIVFMDEELAEDKLKTNVDIRVAPRADSGATYTVEKHNDTWEITEMRINWIS